MQENASLKDLDIQISGNQLTLLANGQNIILDLQQKTIDGFLDAANAPIRFASPQELLKTAALINTIRSDDGLWEEVPDVLKKTDKDYPFALAEGWTTLWSKNIIFKKHDGNQTVISDLLPWISQMDWQFPTIEKKENRNFFVNYLNTLWKNDHPDWNKSSDSQ
ncbi:MAG: hypothetical protein Q4B28_05755 [bacterium]|nr:hypothetical protein [bacterium]